MRWAGLSFGNRQVRQLDLLKRSDIPSTRTHCPRPGSAPRATGSAVPASRERRCARRRRIGKRGVVAVIFIVGLPCSDAGCSPNSVASAVTMRRAGLAIAFMRKVIMPARAEPARRAFSGRPAACPACRRPAISAVSRSACRAPPSAPRHAEYRWSSSANRNQYCPRFGSSRDQANSPMRTIADAEFGHAPGIVVPPLLRPMFRIVADAELRACHVRISP